jgi:hypothetical protein
VGRGVGEGCKGEGLGVRFLGEEKARSAFSLIELIVIITILAIL